MLRPGCSFLLSALRFLDRTHLHEPTPEFSHIKYGFDVAGGFSTGVLEKPAHEEPLIYRRAAFVSPASAEVTGGQPRSLAAEQTLHGQLSDHASRSATGSYQAFLRRRRFKFAGDKVENEDDEIPSLFPGVDFEDCEILPENLQSPLPKSLTDQMQKVQYLIDNPPPKKEEEKGGEAEAGKGKK